MNKRLCFVSGCSNPLYSRGRCKTHYSRWRSQGYPVQDGLPEHRPRDTVRGEKNPNWKNGASGHPLYLIYHDMVSRCHNPSHPRYRDYGGRGIRVCSEWREDFWTFVRDVGDRPEENQIRYTLDREDNDGIYEPGNVRWATFSEQAKNKRGFGDFESRRDPRTGRFT